MSHPAFIPQLHHHHTLADTSTHRALAAGVMVARGVGGSWRGVGGAASPALPLGDSVGVCCSAVINGMELYSTETVDHSA